MVSLKDIKNILSNINIKEDYILIHSNLLIFDKFNFSIEGLWDVLHKTLGNNKTYIMPTFTFSFTKKKIWDYNNSKSETGALTEFLRKKIAKKRIKKLCLDNNISFRSIRFPALNSSQSISLNNPNPPSLFQYLESNPKMINKIF